MAGNPAVSLALSADAANLDIFCDI